MPLLTFFQIYDRDLGDKLLISKVKNGKEAAISVSLCNLQHLAFC